MPAMTGPQAAPWRPREDGRGLVAWRTRQTQALSAAIESVLADWRRAWGLGGGVPAVQCEPATAKAVLDPQWKALCAGQAWLLSPAAGEAKLARLLFGAGGAVAGDVAAECARDLADRLAAVFGPAAGISSSMARDVPLPGLGQPWSGALHAELPGTPGWSLLLGPEAVQAWCRQAGLQGDATPTQRDPLCSAADALGRRGLALEVRLSGCELGLGELQGLRVGDVVRLGHALQDPVRLVDGEGRGVFDAYLVSQQGRKAVELANRNAI